MAQLWRSSINCAIYGGDIGAVLGNLRLMESWGHA
jgi:hypothetical protein